MSQDKIDFSSLDPSRDRDRWDRTIRSLASRALAARERPVTIFEQTARWIRPALALAAAVAIVIWAGTLLGSRPSSRAVKPKTDPAFVLSGWASSQERPSTSRIVQVLGAYHVEK